MIANYHTHTPRCNHAEGSEREYVECALQAGLEILGFSDHTPYLYPEGHHSWFRMRIDQLEDYVSTVLALRKEYAGRIEIPVGLELEYYPDLLPNLLPILRDQPLDYLILGQHYLDNEVGAPYSGRATTDKKLMERFVNQTIDAMQTGLFTYFAHPDILNYQGDDDRFYREQVRRLCREANSCSLPLEVNLLGFIEGKHYPYPRFWEAAAEENPTVILGRDAHIPSQLLDTATEARGMEIVKRFDLKLIHKAELKKIG